MNKFIQASVEVFRGAIRIHPVEFVIIGVACVLAIYDYEYTSVDLQGRLPFYPILFLLVYTLNGVCAGSRFRWGYYASVALAIPVFLLPDLDPDSPIYWGSLVGAQLLYLVSERSRDNEHFFKRLLSYLWSGMLAGAFALLVWLLLYSVYECIRYIFGIWQGGNERFFSYAGITVGMGLFPLLFVLFNRRHEPIWQSRIFQILLNWVFSPFLLVYTVILYLYGAEILLFWSLPEGGVANIVADFVIALFALKGCQPFLDKRHYDWFYSRASWVALPPLLLFWVGTCYRIWEYGFTEDRVYLVVVGVILTVTSLLFLRRRWNSYRYATWLAIILLAGVTYIPGITARDIERISQSARGNWPMSKEGNPRPTLFHIRTDEPMDIRGYATMSPLSYGYDHSRPHIEWNGAELRVYDSAKDTLVYQKPVEAFWSDQLRKVGLSGQDTIPETVYPELLRIELDSAMVILEEITVNRLDASSEVRDIRGAYYLKK